MYIMEAKYRDVEAVMDRLSAISLGEMAANNVTDAWHGLKRAKLCKDHGFLKVIKDGHTPMAIFGAIKDKQVYRTWFIATEDFFAKKITCAKVVAREIARTQARMPHMTFEAYTKPQHPQFQKWFRVIGFKFIEAIDDVMLFRYTGRQAIRAEKDWIA
jgi:hypothetical protein